MKKLMIACAVVAMACAANAAAASWQWRISMAGVVKTDATGTIASGYNIWLLNNADYAAATVLTSLRSYNGAVDTMKDYLDGIAIDTTSLSTGTSAGKMGTYRPSSTGKNSYTALGTLGEEGAANFYAVILSPTDGKQAFISDLTPISVKVDDGQNTQIQLTSIPDDSQSAVFGDITTAYNNGHWYATASAVPEPTSGLLLLLGVAGLALRRRRA